MPSRTTLRPELDEHRLLNTAEAASYTPYNARTLANLRIVGKGPAYIKMANGAVAYRICDLLAWQEGHRHATLDQD